MKRCESKKEFCDSIERTDSLLKPQAAERKASHMTRNFTGRKLLAMFLAMLLVFTGVIIGPAAGYAQAGQPESNKSHGAYKKAGGPAMYQESEGVEITENPKDAKAKVKETAKFTVKVSGAAEQYQWETKNNKGKWVAVKASVKDSAKTDTLKIKASAELEGTVYRCKVTGADGNAVTSKSVGLMILPDITTQPKNKAVALKESFKLTVKATGTEKLTYQWYYQDKGSSKWTKETASGAEKASLSLKASKEMDGRKYRCQVKCSNGEKVNSKAATVTISEEEDPVELSVSADEFTVSGSDNVLYVYAKVSGISNVKKVELYSGSQMIAEMVDDGMFSTTGDDLPNDNIYSCKLVLDLSSPQKLTYSAKVKAGKTYKSGKITVSVVADTTQGEMQDTDILIHDALQSKAYSSLTDSERKKVAKKLLSTLAKDGSIKSNYSYDEGTGLYAFEYANGVLGGIMTKDFADGTDGPEAEERPQDFSVPATKAVPGVADGIVGNALGIGKAAIYFAFEQTNYRLSFYQNTVIPDWEKNGLATDFKQNVTVADMKKLSGQNYNVIVIAMHGSFYNNKPAYCLKEQVTSAKDSLYSNDLQKKHVARVTLKSGELAYWLLPSFFTNHLSANALEGAFVYSQPCCSFGKGSSKSDAMANAFLNKGASVFVGCHNSVLSDYGRKFMKLFVDGLIKGKTAREAFDACVKKYGKTDGQQPNPATPNFRGDNDALLVPAGLRNGSFEEAATPVHWLATGDARVISKLGGLKAKHGNNMAIVTTGIGSAEAEYLSGTEGSSLVQAFRMPKNKSKISFRYNVISEEPMEYVGSQYDDTVIIELLDAKGKVIKEMAKETINEATWYAIEDINFDGGDNTTYETRWKTVTVDLSAYRNKVIAIRILAYDKGDSIYDTVVLVDEIVLK